jgi:tetratricopeptide (TPR) repeat protein
VMGSLVLLTESRGAAIAILASVVVVLSAVPGFRCRVLALAVIAAGFAAIAGPVAAVYSHQSSPLEVSVIHHAAAVTLISAAVTGLVWGALVALARAAARYERWAPLGSRAATALAIALLAAPFVAIAVKHSTVQHKVSTQWNSFVHLSTQRSSAAATQSRLLSGSGARYDYWRVALDVFVAHPIAGVGAGNYEGSYYRLRRTDEAIQNPHSFPLETLSELGIVGAVLLALAAAGVVVGARRLRASARQSLAARTTMVAATGMVVVWFVDSSGDWMQLLPGVAAMALAAAAVLCTEGSHGGAAVRARAIGTHRLGALAGVAVVAFVLAVGGANLARARLTQLYLDQARSELVGHPSAAIRDASRALTLDAANLDAYYVKAAGEAFLHQAAPTLSTLLAAKREDPASFQTWTLLGDLEARLHNFSVAGSFYQRAHKLNPLDPTLATLAANPAAGI